MSEEKKSDFMELRDEQLDEVVGGGMTWGLYQKASIFINNSELPTLSKSAAVYDLFIMAKSEQEYDTNQVKTMLASYGFDVSDF